MATTVSDLRDYLSDAATAIAAGSYASAHVYLALARTVLLGIPDSEVRWREQYEGLISALALAESRSKDAYAIRHAAFRRKGRSS